MPLGHPPSQNFVWVNRDSCWHTRPPVMDMSPSQDRASQVHAPITVYMRNFFPEAKLSDMKSIAAVSGHVASTFNFETFVENSSARLALSNLASYRVAASCAISGIIGVRRAARCA